jgi:hypothetical protein
MNGTQIISRFEKMGAKVNLIATSRSRLPVLNIHSAGNGRSSKDEVFDLTIPDGFSAEVLDCKPSERHLLLMLKGDGDYKAKFLCGHDERHWFVAGVPEAAGASTVVQAKRALMPKDVADETVRKGLKSSKALRRRNKAFIRQGEWFFTPDPWLCPFRRSSSLRTNPWYSSGWRQASPNGVRMQVWRRNCICLRQEDAVGRRLQDSPCI